MSGNSFGHLFTVTSFGESHGPAIGCVVDGCPPGLALTEADIQPELDRRRPGTSRHVTQRQEPDTVEILSGVFEGKTTGAPIALLIRNQDQRSKDYSEIMNTFRPGHADYTYLHKYGIRDYRGGGRSSARETAVRVAAAAIAKKWLSERYNVQIRGHMTQLGEHVVRFEDWAEVPNNPFFAANHSQIAELEAYMDSLRKAGDSCGARINVEATENAPNTSPTLEALKSRSCPITGTTNIWTSQQLDVTTLMIKSLRNSGIFNNRKASRVVWRFTASGLSSRPILKTPRSASSGIATVKANADAYPAVSMTRPLSTGEKTFEIAGAIAIQLKMPRNSESPVARRPAWR